MSRSLRAVPDVMTRRRIPDSAIREVVRQIVTKFSPIKVVLFGSYAHGNPRPESDVDLLVVMRTRREGEQSLVIRQAIPCEFGLDLIVTTPATLKKRLKLGDFLLKEILERGKVLYEALDG